MALVREICLAPSYKKNCPKHPLWNSLGRVRVFAMHHLLDSCTEDSGGGLVPFKATRIGRLTVGFALVYSGCVELPYFSLR